MSEYIVKAMGDLYGNVSFNRIRSSDGPTRGQMGGRGGPSSQQQAVRNAQNYHATGSFGGRHGLTQTQSNVVFGGITLGSAIVSATAPGRVVRAGAAVIGVVSEWIR